MSQRDVAGAISSGCRRTMSSVPVAELKYGGISLGPALNLSELLVFGKELTLFFQFCLMLN